MELISQHSSAHPLVQGYAAYLFGLLVMFNETRTGSFSRYRSPWSSALP